MTLLLWVFQACLAIYCLALLWFMAGLLRREPERTTCRPPVSVIVAVRGGGHFLGRLLDQLSGQDYSPDKLEIVIGDDGLDQSARAALDRAMASDDRIRVAVSASGDCRLTHKKRALDAAIKISQGELLLFTDVDCQVGPRWVSSMASYFTAGVDFVVGWSGVSSRPGLDSGDDSAEAGHPLTVYEQLDFTMLMLAARGATLMGTPWACSGQNQAYRKSLYDRVGGFADLAQRLQGDDSLFLQMARKQEKFQVAFATDPGGRVLTEPSDSLKHFIFQRIRWAADGVAIWRYIPVFVPISVATFVVNLLIPSLALAALAAADTVLPVLLPAILTKALLEAALLGISSRRVPLHGQGHHFPLWFLLQMPLMTIIGLGSFWGNRLPWRHRNDN